MEKKCVIFGAGRWGTQALEEYGKDNVLYFIDNNKNLYGKYIQGIIVRNLQFYLNDKRKPEIVVAVDYFIDIQKQLQENGIHNYSIYIPQFKSYYPSDVLVYNTYADREEFRTEEDYKIVSEDKMKIARIDKKVERLKKDLPLFQHIEIETYNRCNGVCDFCPVSVGNESRTEQFMDKSLFIKIIDELADLDYRGRIALFSNNEPFLDDRILEFHRYARECLPHARFHLFTNGTLLTLDKFIELMKYLDELIIDNYNQELLLIPNCKKIMEYCECHPELIKRVTIVLRKPKEILTTRGGDAPNRNNKKMFTDVKCVNPFIQMIIRPDGKVSLCCNDPLGKNTMGDLKNNTLREIWYGQQFQNVRSELSRGRQYWEHCKYCDTFSLD